MAKNPADEVIVLTNGLDEPEAIVCAIPYLRDQNIRTVEDGESIDDKSHKMLAGLKAHYADVCLVAEQKRQELGSDIPLICMGHLFTAGGKTGQGDGVRELYVGSLAHVGRDALPSCIDYLALGHLHIPQKVGDADHMRYSGSPIAMGFGEAQQQKMVVLVEFNSRVPVIREQVAPCFQRLERIRGDLAKIESGIALLKEQSTNIWLEIEYTGNEMVENLGSIIAEAVAGSLLEVLRTTNKPMINGVLSQLDDEVLGDLAEEDVFIRCMDCHKIGEQEREMLMQSYREIIQLLKEQDANAK
jgi:exonuclease SbcD